MKLVDRYLLEGFLKPFSACVLIFALLVVLGRFFDKMSVFTSYHARARDIIMYITLGLPLWLNFVLPVATLLAVLFSLGQHQQQGEVSALRSAGIPNLRLFTPYFMTGLFLVIFSLVGGLTFLPKVNYESRVVYRVKIKKEVIGHYRREHVVAAGRNQRRYTIGWLDVEKNEMRDVVMDGFDGSAHLIENVSAKRALYREGKWTFYNGKKILYDPKQPGMFIQEDFKEMRVNIDESPQDFALQDKNPEDMTGKDMAARIRRLRLLGVPSSREEVALQSRIALPFAHLVVITLGIPFALKSARKGKLQTFGYALGVAFMYWGSVSIAQSFGEQGYVPAWVAAWVPNFLFLGIGTWLMRKI
jgi:lipopolysaccharide export system permease protein